MPHEKWGEVPKAFVALAPGPHATEQELIDFCRERLAHFKCPEVVEFGELPKTSTGKSRSSCCARRTGPGYAAASTEAPEVSNLRRGTTCP